MNVTYDYYKIFYNVAKYGSLTKAAQITDSSQPNITRAMNNLEAQLKISLFIRTKKGVVLTEAGQKLFDRLTVAFEQIQIAERELDEIRNLEVGTVTVGATDIALYEILLPSLSEFRKEYPNISIRIQGESTTSAIRNLKEDLIDFAIVTEPIPENDFCNYSELRKIQEYAVASKNFFVNDIKIKSIYDLVNYPIIMLSTGTGTRKFYDELFASYKMELEPQMLASSVNQAIYMIKMGLGIGFVPKTIVDVDDEIVKINIKEEIPQRKIFLVKDKNRQHSYASSIMAEWLVKLNKK